MDQSVRDAIASAMLRLESFKSLSETEFQSELEWQLRNMILSSTNRIMWQSFEVGRELLRSICNSQHLCCYYCKVPLEVSRLNNKCARRPTFEHIIPLSKGGVDHPDNMVVACYSCNHRRGNVDVDFFV